MPVLLENQTADGTGPTRSISSGALRARPGLYLLTVTGPFDGAQVTLELKLPPGDWVTIHEEDGVTDLTITTDREFTLHLSKCQVRAAVANVGAGTSITAVLERVR